MPTTDDAARVSHAIAESKGGMRLLGNDQPVGDATCLHPGCTATLVATDVCCPTHGDILGWHPVQPASAAWFVRLLPGFAALTVVPFAARMHTPFIVFVLWLTIGAALSWLLTLRWRASRAALPRLWLITAALAGSVRLLDRHPAWSWAPTTVAWLELVAVAIWLVAAGWWTFTFTGGTRSLRAGRDDENEENDALPYVGVTRALLLATVFAVAAVVCGSRLGSRVTKDRDWIVHWLHRAATISAIGTIVGVLAACLFRSWHRVDSTVHPLFGTPTAPERPRWRDDEVARADEDLRRTWIENLGIAATTAAETAVNLVQRAAYLAAAIETAMINKIAAFGALSARHAAMTVRFAGRTGVETVYVVPAVVRRFVRAVGLPTVALAAGSYATWGSATRITSYLHDGPIVDAIAGVGLGIVSVALVFVAWGSMIGGPVGPIAQSVSNIIANVGAQAGLFVVAAGWVDGLAGSLGVGPMRVGPVTIVGTVILAAAVFRASARPRRVATPDES